MKVNFAYTLEARKNRWQMFFKIGVLKNFGTFTAKQLCWSLFFNKVAGLLETPTQVFSCKYCEIFKNSFSIEHLGWLFLRREIRQ